MANKNYKPHVFYEQNLAGRDFVVGDLHGCYEDLLRALTMLNFDGQVDRLFSVGDLVDRGPDSFKCANLIYEPWFFAVKGNHEELMYETMLRNSRDHAGTWLGNGGQWFASEDEGELKAVCRDIEMLPYVISVGEGENRFNIVHAELKRSRNWEKQPVTDMSLDHWDFSNWELADMMWGRTIISNGKRKIEELEADELWHDMDNLSLTFVGHTPVRNVVQVQKHMYIDTGAVYHHTSQKPRDDNALTLACPTEKMIYSYNMAWKTLTKKSFDEIEKLG